MLPAQRPTGAPRLFGLLLLMLGNFVLYLAWCFLTNRFYQAFLGLPPFLMSLQSAITQSQRASYGIAAALIPQRRFVGLVWAVALALINGLIHAEFVNLISISRAGNALPLKDLWVLASGVADQTMAMFALTQGIRFALGWRLVPTDEPRPRGQFHLMDMLEWTASVGAWLAINRLVALDPANLYQYSIGVLGLALTLIPIALVATSDRGLRTATALILLAWVLTVEAFFYVLGYAVDPSSFTQPRSFYLSLLIGGVAGSLLYAGLNFWIIRRLGFRWEGSKAP
jgi:hypothetical protein